MMALTFHHSEQVMVSKYSAYKNKLEINHPLTNQFYYAHYTHTTHTHTHTHIQEMYIVAYETY